MKFSAYILPVVILSLFIYGAFKKVKLYDSFADGASGAFTLALRLFPYLCAVFVITQFFEASGLASYLEKLMTPLLKLVGIPPELARLMLIKPLSGSGSLAILTQIYNNFGADSYIARCASVIYSGSETIFYLGAIYFAKQGGKKNFAPIAIALVASIISSIFAAFICIIM